MSQEAPWEDDPIIEDAPASGGAAQPQGAASAGPEPWENDPIIEPSWTDRINTKLIERGGPKQQHMTPEWQHEALQGTREVVRQIGRAGQMAATGASSVVTVPYDALMGLVDLALERGGFKFRLSGAGEALRQLVDDPELRDRDSLESVVRATGESLAGAAGGIGLGSQLAARAPGVVSSIGESLAAAPGEQAASAVLGGAAAGTTRELGGGPVAQTVAGMAGAMVPSARATWDATVRGVARGGEEGRVRVANAVDDFAAAGTAPTVGQATQGRVARGAEALFSRVPGGAGPMARRAESQADEISAAVENIASKLATVSKTGAERAGMAIERGVTGDQSNSFLSRFRDTARRLYADLDQHLPPQSPVSATNTVAKLNELTRPIEGFEDVAKLLSNAKVVQIRDALNTGMGGRPPSRTIDILDADGRPLSSVAVGGSPATGALPYEVLTEIRSKVGSLLSANELIADIPRGQLKQLWGALSADMKVAAQAAGPEAERAFYRANKHYQAGLSRLDLVQRVLNKHGGAEEVFAAAVSNTKNGATKLRSVMQSLPRQEQRVVTATFLRRMGLAKAGVQNDLGNQFSTETFLTNWNLLSDQAKRVLFDRWGHFSTAVRKNRPGIDPGLEIRKDLDRIASVANNIRTGSKVFRNPSGTSGAEAQAYSAGAVALSVITGQLDKAAMIGGTIAGANLLARLMTNRRFVRFLAGTTKFPASQAPALINQLSRIAQNTGDADMAEAAALLQQQLQGSDINADTSP